MKLTVILICLISITSCKVITPVLVVNQYSKNAGYKLPEFTLIDSTNTSISSEDIFKGKVTYLTVGAMDCGGNTQFLKADLPILMNQFTNFDDIQFVNIIITKDEKQWCEFINTTNPLGINLRFNGNREELFKKLKFDYFPFESVINEDGEFVGSDLCGIGRNAAPYFALHKTDFKKGFRKSLKYATKHPISAAYVNEIIKDGNSVTNQYSNLYGKSNKNSIINTQDIKASQLITTIKKANKNKVIYIDFWSTWCSPCKNEIFTSQKLQEKLNDDNIVFIYVCINSEIEQCKKYINTNSVKGQHFFLNKEESKLISEMYNITGVPFYLIFSPDGIRINESFRPSDAKAEEKLLKIKAKA